MAPGLDDLAQLRVDVLDGAGRVITLRTAAERRRTESRDPKHCAMPR